MLILERLYVCGSGERGENRNLRTHQWTIRRYNILLFIEPSQRGKHLLFQSIPEDMFSLIFLERDREREREGERKKHGCKGETWIGYLP